MNEKEMVNKLNTYKKYYIIYSILFASGIIIEISPGFLVRVNYTIVILIGVIIMLSGAVGMERINYLKYKILKPEMPEKSDAKNYAYISGFFFIVGGFLFPFFYHLKSI